MSILMSYLVNFLEIASMYMLLHAFLHISFKPSYKDFIACVLMVILTGSIPDKYTNILLIVGQLCYISCIIIIYIRNIINVMILYSMMVISLLFVQFLLILFFSIAGISTNAEYINIVASTLTLIFVSLLSVIIPIYKLYNTAILSALPVRLFLVNAYLIYFSVLLTFRTNEKYIISNPSYLFTIITLVIAINVCILYYDRNLQYKDQMLNSYKKNLPIYESLIGEIRTRQHEYSNRILAFQSLPSTCKDYESICSALNSYSCNDSTSSRLYPLLQIDKPLLAASLYSLAERASSLNVTLHFNIVTKNINSIAPEYVLSDLSCILTQNAIEASYSGQSVYIKIDSYDNHYYIETRNMSDRLISQTELNSFYQRGYTTKTVKKADDLPHGLGLSSLLHTIDSYNGSVGSECIEYDNNYWVIFNLSI